MSGYVELRALRERGWLWPQSSFGLSSMYGPDGWCQECGVPSRSQSGPVTLQRKAIRVEGAWTPHWHPSVLCAADALGSQLTALFGVERRSVAWHPAPAGIAAQLVVPVTDEPWFDITELEVHVRARHGLTGKECATCGTWKWLPMDWGQLPLIRWTSTPTSALVSGPEWFGAGKVAFHQVLAQDSLAAMIERASPRDFALREVVELTAPGALFSSLHGAETFRPGELEPSPAIFTATLLPRARAEGMAGSRQRVRADRVWAALQRSGGLVSAEAATEAAQSFFDAGEVDQARHLWYQAALHGDAHAWDALARHRS